MHSKQYQLVADSSGEGVNEGVRIVEPSGEAKIDEMDKVNEGALANKNIIGFDITVNDVSRVDEFQMEKPVLELRKISIYNNKNQ